MTPVTLHGLGRFGQHLLHAWLAEPGSISIDCACDEELDIVTVCQMLVDHDRLDFSSAEPAVCGHQLLLTRADGVRHRIDFSRGPAFAVPWLGKTVLWLECSGRYVEAEVARRFCCGDTRQVIVSATSPGADQTIVLGLNHARYSANAQVVSYGSCTINAFAPLAERVYQAFGVEDADVHIIHNVPSHRLAENRDPVRRHCTLVDMAPSLLPWLSAEHFFVSYTLIPYTGPSSITFRFGLESRPDFAFVTEALLEPGSRLEQYYSFPDKDVGIWSALGEPYNAVLPRDAIRMVGNNLIMQGYLDNENSAVRYLDLVQMAGKAHAVAL